MRLAALAAFTALLAIAGTADAREIPVRSAADIAKAASRAGPGDTLLMTDGEWRDQAIVFEGQGREGAPLRLAARTPGKVLLTGTSRIEIGGRWLEVSGLRFENGSLREGQEVVAFRTRRSVAADSRLTNSAIVAYNPPDMKTRYIWVALFGVRNRVDHNLFTGQRHSGPTIAVVRDQPVRDEHRIDHNHFSDRVGGDGNGYETIRIGTSKQAASDSGTIVEYNLFERTNGEIEAVSVKSGGNQIRHNTFVEVQGSITLRNGHGNSVIGNILLGNGVPGTGGIRVMGSGHVVTDNQVQNISKATGGAITLNCGHATPRPAANDPVYDVRIERNTVIDFPGPAINATQGCGTLDRTVAPRGLVIEGNRVIGEQSSLSEGDASLGWKLGGNLVAQPQQRALVKRASGLIDVTPIASDAPPPPVLTVLTAKDVGPDWQSAIR